MTSKFIEHLFDVQQYGGVFAAYLRPHYLDGDPTEWIPVGQGSTPLEAIVNLCDRLHRENHPMSRRHILQQRLTGEAK